MKKYMMLSVAALSLLAAPVMAEEHADGKKGMFERHDTNGDGTVSKDEFMAHAEIKFKELDADGNGSISKAESDAKREEWKAKMKEKRAKAKEQSAPDPVPPTTPPAQ